MNSSIPLLAHRSAWVRQMIMETASRAGKGHIAPALSCVDILVTLYYGGYLQHDCAKPKWQERDRLFFSKGHACLTLYTILGERGFFDIDELKNFETDGHMLGGHPDQMIPGVEYPSGSLGHGLGVGAGAALAAKQDNQDWRSFVVMGDGECQEGSVWEAFMFAAQHKLDNLIAIIDRNGLGATDRTENTSGLESLDERVTAMGWDARRIDGNDVGALTEALEYAQSKNRKKPFCIIADTIKGKGVSFMEDSPSWHHQMPKDDLLQKAITELRDKELETKNALGAGA
ncbi:MAG: transketolase [Candidatus Omnitrophota bacterium]|jgi:transketolase